MTARAVEGLVAKWRKIAESSWARDYVGVCNDHAEELEQALAADLAAQGEMPELPVIQRVRVSSGSYPMVNDPAGDYVDYDDHVAAMRAYGQQCARTYAAHSRDGEGEVYEPVAYRVVDRDGLPCPVFGRWVEYGYRERPGAIKPVLRDGFRYEYAYADSTPGDIAPVAWIEAEPSTPDLALFSDVPVNMVHSTMVHIGKNPPAKRQSANKLFPLYTTPPTPSAGVEVTEEACIAIYDAVTRSNFTRDVKTPVKKVAIVTNALTAALEGGK